MPADTWAARLTERGDYHGLAAVFADNASYADSGDWNRRMDAAKAALRSAGVNAIAPIEDLQKSFSGRLGRDRLESILSDIRQRLK